MGLREDMEIMKRGRGKKLEETQVDERQPLDDEFELDIASLEEGKAGHLKGFQPDIYYTKMSYPWNAPHGGWLMLYFDRRGAYMGWGSSRDEIWFSEPIPDRPSIHWDSKNPDGKDRVQDGATLFIKPK